MPYSNSAGLSGSVSPLGSKEKVCRWGVLFCPTRDGSWKQITGTISLVNAVEFLCLLLNTSVFLSEMAVEASLMDTF